MADISAGLRHSLATTGNSIKCMTSLKHQLVFLCTVGGDLFAWGDGKKGQLGLGVKELDTQRSPRCGERGAMPLQ